MAVMADRAPAKDMLSSKECQPFDVNLLCAKLEAAKLEQDLARSRARYRRSRGYSALVPPIRPDPRRSIPTATDVADACSNETTTSGLPVDPKKGVHPKQLFAALKIGKSEPERKGEQADPLRTANGHLDNSGIDSGADLDEPELVNPQYPSQNYLSDTMNRTKRRSSTFPMQPNNLTTKKRPMSVDSHQTSREFKTLHNIGDEYDQEPSGLDERQHDPLEKLRLTSRLRRRSRSLLNLHQKLRKDGAQVGADEGNIDEEDILEKPRLYPDAHHIRQKSLPIDLNVDTLPRPMTEERDKKRRTFMGFFKK